MLTAEKIIKLYGLKLHPGEGGYYKETYRASETIPSSALHERYDQDKAHSTSILYMLTPEQVSKFHRIKSDEVWHFYLGDPVQMFQLYPDGTCKVLFLGHEIEAGQFVQAVVPAGVWQGLFLLEGGRFALMGTTVAPGFDFSDWELPDRQTLLDLYPDHKDTILRLTAE